MSSQRPSGRPVSSSQSWFGDRARAISSSPESGAGEPPSRLGSSESRRSCGCTQEELAHRVGKERSSIANTLRLLRLPGPIQDDLRGGRLTMGHARALLALGTPAEQLKLRDEILAHDWSVRATEDTVRTATAGRPPKPKQRRRSVEMTALEESLQRSLMTRVRIVGSDRQGRIEITYANADELERLAALLGTRH
jgi:ParB family chromosome partitioning protein